ncbi:CrcB-like protein-domain-containing protein [Mycena amicta]|nr:CrcB-like protein-domain-containing protein [Mycena amicta]
MDPTGADVKERSPPTFHPLSLNVLALLMPFSVFGVLARLGLSALGNYNGQSIFPLIYAQAVGCLIMGFCLALRGPFSQYYPPAYTALTTGFCGSLTTFSGWELDIFKSWLNASNVPRSGLNDVIDGICKTAFTISVCLSSLFYGMHLAHLVSPYFRAAEPPNRFIQHAISVLSVCIYAATIPAYYLLPRSYRHQATAALLFSFPGTLTRYLLSTYLNPVIASFPLGTFAANTSGTALLGTFHVLQSTTTRPLSGSTCTILQGLADGYCGCLTTISTLAAEVATLKTPAHKYRYGLITWVTGQLILVCIFGALLWGGDISKNQSCAFG